MTDLSLRATRFYRLLRRVQRPLTRFAEQKALSRHTVLAQDLLAELRDDGQVDFAGRTPRITRALRTRSDVVVLLIGDAGLGEPAMVLKLPLTPAAEQSTAVHRKVVLTLHQTPDLDRFCALIPRSLAWGEHQGQTYYLETALPGTAAAELVRAHAAPATLLPQAVRTIRLLHRATAERQVVDAGIFGRVAGGDLGALRLLAPHWPEARLLMSRLDQLEAQLQAGLVDRELPFAWSHGDYWPGNILVCHESGALSGIVDWDRASAQQLPLLDILHLLAYTRKMQRRTELGEEVVSYLLPAAFAPEERALVDETLDQLGLPQDPGFYRAAALLYWLQFAATNLSRYPSFQRDHVWMRNNVFLVLKRGLS